MSDRPPRLPYWTITAGSVSAALSGLILDYGMAWRLSPFQQQQLGRYWLTTFTQLIPSFGRATPGKIEHQTLFEIIYDHQSLLQLYLPLLVACGILTVFLVMWGSAKDARIQRQWREGIQTRGPELLSAEEQQRRVKRRKLFGGKNGFTLFLERIDDK